MLHTPTFLRPQKRGQRVTAPSFLPCLNHLGKIKNEELAIMAYRANLILLQLIPMSCITSKSGKNCWANGLSSVWTWNLIFGLIIFILAIASFQYPLVKNKSG